MPHYSSLNPHPADIGLLRHERFESNYMATARDPAYERAHDVHDRTAARTRGKPSTAGQDRVVTFSDRVYRGDCGAGPAVRVRR